MGPFLMGQHVVFSLLSQHRVVQKEENITDKCPGKCGRGDGTEVTDDGQRAPARASFRVGS